VGKESGNCFFLRNAVTKEITKNLALSKLNKRGEIITLRVQFINRFLFRIEMMRIQSFRRYASVCLCIIACTNLTFAQNQGNIWYFGDQAGLDFNSSPPIPLLDGQTYFPTCCGWNECTSSICDSSGTLLFYTNGEKIWNSQQQVMENGNNLLGHASSTASSLIVPQPGNDQYFYVFTTDAWENGFSNGLRYSVVDMCLNNNLGAVIPTMKNIELYSFVAEKLAAVLHSDGNKYWIISHEFDTDVFCSFLLTSEGIQDTIISSTGTIDPQGWGGQMVVSPDGQKIAYAIPNAQPGIGRAMLFDFDATNGMVSNEQILSIGGREYGASFSPDNSKLYFSTIGVGSLYQYDLNQTNTNDIIESRVTMFENQMDSWRDHLLGPDDKIYISRAGQQFLSVIENPNESYPFCNYVDNGIGLSDRFASFGLPKFVAGYNYLNRKRDCTTTSAAAVQREPGFSIYPNPFNSNSTITLFENLNGANIDLYNVKGEYIKNIGTVSGYSFNFSRGNLAAGMYLIVIGNSETMLFERVVVTE